MTRSADFQPASNLWHGAFLSLLSAFPFDTPVKSQATAWNYDQFGRVTNKVDADGNMTNDGNGISYEYDAANRTIAINRGITNRTEFLYDGQGRRIQIIEKTNGVAYVTNKFIWCGLELCEQRDNTGANALKRFFGQGEQISGTNYFFTYDHLGSIREMVDGSGTIQARYDYDPYGVRTKIQGTMDADFGFTGHFVLGSQPEHALTPFRLYRTDFGRWLSLDPIGENGGLNLYNYVGGDPINGFDPLGLANIDRPLPQGWSANVQGVPGGLTYEIHVYNPQGNEVGVLNQRGWINKHHAQTTVPTLSEDVANALNGLNVKEARARNFVPEKGLGDIKYMKGRLARFGGAAGVVLIFVSINAFADQVKDDLSMYLHGCNGNSNDQDWALLALLDMRAAGNAQMPFVGDVLMHAAVKLSDGNHH